MRNVRSRRSFDDVPEGVNPFYPEGQPYQQHGVQVSYDRFEIFVIILTGTISIFSDDVPMDRRFVAFAVPKPLSDSDVVLDHVKLVVSHILQKTFGISRRTCDLRVYAQGIHIHFQTPLHEIAIGVPTSVNQFPFSAIVLPWSSDQSDPSTVWVPAPYFVRFLEIVEATSEYRT